MATRNSPEKFRIALRESILDLLWRQWRSLGIPGHGPEAVQPVDVEAAILGAALAAKHDLRLWNAVLEWLSVRREWVNGARLKRMAAPFIRDDERLKLPLIDADAWSRVNGALDSAQTGHSGSSSANPPPRLRKKALLQLFLRGIFGVNARAELILFLLMKGEGNSNQIAREIQFDQKNIYVILERWTETGLIIKQKRGRQNLYLLKPGMLSFLPQETVVEFWNWEPFFRLFGRLLVASYSEPWMHDAYLLSSLFRSIHGETGPFARIAQAALPDSQLLPGEELFEPMAKVLPRIPESF